MPKCLVRVKESETNLQLCLQQVGAFSLVRVAISILRLQAAFGIEPPLHTGYIVALFVILRFVFVEVVVRCYNVELGKHVYGCGGIVSVALYMPVLTGKIFGTQADGFGLDGSSCRPTVTYITVACSNVRIDGRCGYCASLALDELPAYR